MGCWTIIGILFAVLGAVYFYLKKIKVPRVPTLEEKWWGPGTAVDEDTSVRSVKIDVPDEVIQDLRLRLYGALPFHPPLEGVNQNYGINTKLLETIVDYWKNKYDWKQRQEFLNQYPQFKTSIQGLKIHFIHAKPKDVPQGVEILPLMLVHGWPGSIREFYEIIPILTTPQKGDWGSAVTQALAILYPSNVLGIHRNLVFGGGFFNVKLFLASIWPSLFFTEREVERNYPFFSKQFNFLLLEGGYLHLQATKPDTIGVALRESPVGLAAYIIEKFITWTNPAWKDLPDGGLTKKFTYDQLLDNVMIYWVTKSITTSMRLYSEAFGKGNPNIGRLPVRVPAGCARFKHEISYPPESVIRKSTPNLIHLSDFEDGGHFAAFELPEVLGEDIFEFVEKVRSLPEDRKNL